MRWNKRYCSEECKLKCKINKIQLMCSGCGKEFEQFRWFKRKTNYCSTECYRSSTKLKEKRSCKVCAKEFWAKNFHVIKGFGIYCSRECQFKDYPKRIRKNCEFCGKFFSVQPSIQNKRNHCNKKCFDDSMRDYVTCNCRNCHVDFEIPRWELNRGRGTFCKYKCFIEFQGETYIEGKVRKILEKMKVEFIQEAKFNRFRIDFLVGKVAIECDGEYWHQSEYAKDRDSRKDKLLASLGYKIVRLAGKKINNSSENTLQKLIEKALSYSSKTKLINPEMN
ncbi:MAG: DUF559 domain-containing protein [Patescibacteria group bacterium]